MSITAAPTTPLTIDWSSGVTNAWSSIASFVPKLLVFLVVLIVGVIVAKAIAKFVGILLGRIGFERILTTGEVGSMVRATGIQPIALITKLVYYFILLIALQLALSAFGPTNPVSQIVNNIVNWLPQAVVAIVILIVAIAVAGAVKDILRDALRSVSYGELLTKIVGTVIVALGVIAALDQVGVGTTVTMPVLIAVLATVGGILVVGVGGGLIGPMRSRWESWLTALGTASSGIADPGSTGTASTYGAPAPVDPQPPLTD